MKQQRLYLLLVLFVVFSLAIACGSSKATPDVEATVAAAVAETDAAKPTDTPIPPTDTPVPPTNTPEPEPTATPEPEIEIATSLSAYTDPDGLFEISLPNGWDLSTDTGSVFSEGPDGTASVGVLGIPLQVILSEADLQAYGEDFLNGAFGDNGLTINDSWMEDDGSAGYDFTVGEEGSADNPLLEGLLYIEQRGLDLFQLITIAEADAWDPHADLFNDVVASYYVTTADASNFLSEPLPLSTYTDPADLFSIDLPEDWSVDSDAGIALAIAPNDQTGIFVIATELDADFDLEAVGVDIYADSFLSEMFSGGDYTINDIEQQPDGSYAVDFTIDDGETILEGYMYVEQRESYLYQLIFQAANRDWFGMTETFDNITASYLPNPPASAAEPTPIPIPTATSAPVPTATPAPAPPSNSYAPQSGRSRIYIVNEYPEELIFTINNQEHKIPLNSEFPIDLDAGKYTYTISIPFGSVNGEVDMGPNQSWAIFIYSDGGLTNPVQVYP